MSNTTIQRNWRKDLFAGFVVSLIALPLSLGLALASGAPPFAGIITAVIGGSVVAYFGGSYVTITGPGNGLSVATLVAISTLAGGDMHQGYLFALAAIVLSGVLLFVLGVFKAGALGDFFPSSAVQGMLAAIGIIILAKQFHLMLGEDKPDGTQTLSLLTEIPETLAEAFRGEVGILTIIVGLGSLLIMFFYSKIRNKFFHYIPAPMWVVFLSVGTGYYYEYILEKPYPIPPELMVSVPEKLLGGFVFPDFSLIGESNFWSAVFSLTLIACVESLLSIKGVERLDPLSRRVKINKDLKALGIATTISGLLGGLNVVAVIARSSVNVSNGATSRLSNLFHGLFILIFILLFRDILIRIPLPALAAILVYTGYKLASPDRWLAVYRIGKEQLLVFTITLIATLALGIIWGITIGILITFSMQLVTSGRGSLILKRLIRPNVLLFEEENEKFIISIKNFSNFLNFSRLKKQLDACPPNGHVIVDFSLAEFVDNSTLENLNNYKETFVAKGGDLEIIGLDDLQTQSIHPFAPWKPLPSRNPKNQFPSKRQRELSHYAEKIGGTYESQPLLSYEELTDFNYFKSFTVDILRNHLLIEKSRAKLSLFDLDYHRGEFIARDVYHSTFIVLEFDFELPSFHMDKELLIDRVANLATHKDLNVPEFPDFSRRFRLSGKNEEEVLSFFDVDLILFFESNPIYHIESKGKKLLIFKKERLLSPSEIKGMVSFATQLESIILKS